jgi:hypothetical protein
MLVVLALSLPIGQLLTVRLHSMFFAAVYWGGVLLLTLWVVLLAVTDVVATRLHYGRRRDDYLIERAKLEAQLKQMKHEADATGDDESDAPE